MPVSAKGLSSGQLPDAKGTIYTATRPIEVVSLSLVNTGVGSEAITIYVKRLGGTSRAVFVDSALSAGSGTNACYFGTTFILNPGDLIEGVTTTASTVDYDISGRIS
jgi:hypothetical protein